MTQSTGWFPGGNLKKAGSVIGAQTEVQAFTNGINTASIAKNAADNYISILDDVFTDRFMDLSSNTFLGIQAGSPAALSGNEYNTGIGYRSLASLTSGNTNTAVGYTSMSALTTGRLNVSIGSHSLYNLISADDNVAIGYQAGLSLETGDSNVMMGRGAMMNSGVAVTKNIAIGRYAMRYNNNNYNVGIGTDVMSDASGTGQQCVVIGYQAGKNATGNYNTYLGHQAGYSSGTGKNNVYLGRQAGYSGAGASYNVGIGRDSLYYNQSGEYNVAQGYYALFNTTGARNTAIGANALAAHTSGNDNIAIGYGAGDGAATALSNCIYIGKDVGQTNTLGSTLHIGNGTTTLLFGSFGNKNLGLNYPGNLTAFGSGKGVFVIADAATVPTGNATNGVILFSEGGALKAVGGAGTITTIAVP